MKSLYVSLLAVTVPVFTFASTATDCKGSIQSGLFTHSLASPTVQRFSIMGDFARAKEISGGGNWTGEDRPMEEYGVPVEIEVPAPSDGNPTAKLTAMMRVRGMSSADTAEFPKLKVKMPEESRDQQGLFQGVSGFRINTSGFNNDPMAPFREALAYEMAEVLGLPSPKFQRAKIEYRQSSDGKTYNVLPEQQALLIENDNPMLKRMGVTDVGSEFYENLAQVDTKAASLFFVFHALIANDDIGLRVRNEPTMGTEKYRPLFNTKVVKAVGEALAYPLVYDLDKSRMVDIGDQSRIEQSQLLGQPLNGAEGVLLTTLSRLRQRLTEVELGFAIHHVIAKLPELRALVDSRENLQLVDILGVKQARLQLSAFERMVTLFRQIKITLVETHIYSEPKAKPELSLLPLDFSDNAIPLRPGTPMKILERSKDGKFLKVVFLDTRFDVKKDLPKEQVVGPNEYVGYVDAKLLLGDQLTEEQLGFTNEADMAYHF